MDERKTPEVPTRLKVVELIGRMRGHLIERHELIGREGGDIVLQIRPAGRGGEVKKIDLDSD